MTTAIVGLGNIGSRLASQLAHGGEPVILVERDPSSAQAMAGDLGDMASAATVKDAVEEADAVILAVYLDAEKKLVTQLSPDLHGKVVIDPSNPVGPDGQGGMARTLPEDQSAASVISSMLPDDAHYVKAFGAIGAEALGTAPEQPGQLAMFYATDDDMAARTAERLIRAAGLEPVKVGGVDTASRIEMGGAGDLHQFGGLNGRVLSANEAKAAV